MFSFHFVSGYYYIIFGKTEKKPKTKTLIILRQQPVIGKFSLCV